MTDLISPILAQEINDYRQRAAAGELSLDAMKRIIIHLRAGRVNAAAASATTKRKAAAKAVPAAADLLSELESL